MIFPCELYHTAPTFCWWIEPGESFNKKVRKTLRIDIIIYMTHSSIVLRSVVSWALRPQTFLLSLLLVHSWIFLFDTGFCDNVLRVRLDMKQHSLNVWSRCLVAIKSTMSSTWVTKEPLFTMIPSLKSPRYRCLQVGHPGLEVSVIPIDTPQPQFPKHHTQCDPLSDPPQSQVPSKSPK